MTTTQQKSTFSAIGSAQQDETQGSNPMNALDTTQDQALEAVDAQARQRIAQALEAVHAPETRRVYQSAWKQWAAYAEENGHTPLPALPETVAAYLTDLAQAGKSKSSLGLTRAAIGHVHKEHGAVNPCQHSGVERVLKGLRRSDQRSGRQAAALTATALAAIEATACLPRAGRGGNMERPQTATRRGRVDIALCRVLRDGLLRRSELTALVWGDITLLDNGAATLSIQRGKTDKDGTKTTAYLSRQTVKALDALRPQDAPQDAPIFGLTGHQVANRVAQAARAAGLGDGFNGHSGRVGMAQDLAAAGVEMPALQTAGGWKSAEMPAHYTRHQAAARGAVAQYYGEA